MNNKYFGHKIKKQKKQICAKIYLEFKLLVWTTPYEANFKHTIIY